MTQDQRETEAELLKRFSEAGNDRREKVYVEYYEGRYQRRANQERMPTRRRRRRIKTYCRAIGTGHHAILELGCGVGDLTYALRGLAGTVIGTDVSLSAVRLAKSRRQPGSSGDGSTGRVVFAQMNATSLAFPERAFDAALSTSMIEHLYSGDVGPHLQEVWRVLKPGGKYLVWCPNALGHHDDRDVHLSMFSYKELIAAMRQAGFADFRSFMFNRFGYGVNAGWKVFLEELFAALRIRILWSHLGLRNILLLGTKPSQRP